MAVIAFKIAGAMALSSSGVSDDVNLMFTKVSYEQAACPQNIRFCQGFRLADVARDKCSSFLLTLLLSSGN